MTELQFPKGFLWGTATSAHQVEGNNTKNDWWAWEQSAKRLKELGAKGLEPKNFQSGRACDHYHRFEEDFDLAKSLGTNAHRFSIEWSRIEPEEGRFDQAEIDHYRKVLLALHRRGLEPFVTLWHFTNPLWFSRLGGWESSKSVFYFTRFVSRMAHEYGDLVHFWITLNEPNVYVGFAHVLGAWPPQKRGFLKAIRASWNLAAAHVGAYETLHRVLADPQVGLTILATYMMPLHRLNPLDWLASTGHHLVHNVLWLRFIGKSYDFIGIDHYHRSRMHVTAHPPFLGVRNPNTWTNDMGWDVFPEGICHIAKWASRYNVPVYITENGTADADDDHRARFIVENLRWLKKAIDEGADVRGYFHWSLMDNFEWHHGFAPRFGLFEVDHKISERKRRPSAEVYRKICETNSLPENPKF